MEKVVITGNTHLTFVREGKDGVPLVAGIGLVRKKDSKQVELIGQVRLEEVTSTVEFVDLKGETTGLITRVA